MVEFSQEQIHEAIQSAPPWWKIPSLVRLYLLLLAPMLTSTAFGFDLIMTNGLQSVQVFMDNFGHPSGSTLGLYGASISVGGLVGTIVGGPLIDRFGRRAMVSVGATIVIGMALMQSFATNFGMFVGGKLILGFGANFQLMAAPMLVTELAHPKSRVAITSYYNTSIFLGMIIGAWITFGTYSMPSQWSWKIPCIVQLILPCYQAVMCWFCPESPRWLVSKGRVEEARAILIKYHGNGVENEIVRIEMQEILAGIEADKTLIKPNWEGLKTMLGTKGNRHRLWVCCWTAIGSQSLGSGFVALYLPKILDQIGMTTSKEKTLINGIMTICNWVVSIIAAAVIPKVGRRPVFLVSTIGMTVAFIVWTALTAQYIQDPKVAYGRAVICMIFICNFFTAMCWIPLVIAYPLETVTTKQRAIFFAITYFAMGSTSLVTSYINPVGLDSIGWRYYIPQCIWNTIIVLVIYFTFVETKGLTLEEIATLFDGHEDFEVAVTAVTVELDAKHGEPTINEHVEESIVRTA